MVAKNNTRQRVLIVGSSGTTGMQLIHALFEQKASLRPIIFAFCQDVTNVDMFTKERCNRVIQGDSEDEDDIERAMQKSKADVVIFATPKEISSKISNQAALNAVLQRPQYQHVKLFVLASHGAKTSSIEDGHQQQQAPNVQPTPQHDRRIIKTSKRKVHVKRAIQGLSEFFSTLQYLTCSLSTDMFLNTSESSIDPATRIIDATSQRTKKFERELHSHQQQQEPHRQSQSLSQGRDDDDGSQRIHITIDRESLVNFVVGAVMDDGSVTSDGDCIHRARDITICAE